MHFETISYISPPTYKKNDTAILRASNSNIFIGKSDGSIELVEYDDKFTPILSFQSHIPSFDILSNTKIEPAINAIEKYDPGTDRTYLFSANGDDLKLFSLKDKEREELYSSRYFPYTCNSISPFDDFLLSADYLTIKLDYIDRLGSPLTLINNKDNYGDQMVLITKAKMLNNNFFGYAQNNGTICLNDMRFNIKSQCALTVSSNFSTFTDFVYTSCYLFARSPLAVSTYDMRNTSKPLFINYLKKNEVNRSIYQRYSIQFWQDNLITAIENEIHIINKDYDSYVIYSKDTNRIEQVEVINENAFSIYYDGKLTIFDKK